MYGDTGGKNKQPQVAEIVERRGRNRLGSRANKRRTDSIRGSAQLGLPLGITVSIGASALVWKAEVTLMNPVTGGEEPRPAVLNHRAPLAFEQVGKGSLNRCAGTV